jgi:hypothetical protein
MMDKRWLRAGMWLLAVGVATVAAIVSFSHIYDLGRQLGGTGVAIRLMPFSVDMLIVAGELMLLHEADERGRRFTLGWVLVWSGILATLAANMAYGAQHGIVGAVYWGWPAYSFILAAAGMVAIVKRSAAPAPALDAAPQPQSASETATLDLAAAPAAPQPQTAGEPAAPPAPGLHVVRPAGAAGVSKMDRLRQTLAAARAAGETLSAAELARRAGASPTLARGVIHESHVPESDAESESADRVS